VDYPVDTVVLENDSFNIVENRFERKELNHLSELWNNSLKEIIHKLPADILKKAFSHEEIEESE
jgi:putative proteasome-type protease